MDLNWGHQLILLVGLEKRLILTQVKLGRWERLLERKEVPIKKVDQAMKTTQKIN